ncbi:discoidin domain-containing receptor 2-like [Ctenocephalides felis]|uniref:discoidin domain-containing receptor 2-like n=1 Tax=Ctenocephalides felis TaxID=7515 RepID=UPI000E6E3000|nr:discoidin domain-containing receptor 2-like [Ctenocephalides felis]
MTFCLLTDKREQNMAKVLTGNSDTASVVEHRLLPPIFASKVRLFPHSLHRRTVCLRAELLGCMDDGGIVSYSIPQSPEPELSDSSYDGNRTSGRLTGGLGRLVDGQYGADNFRLDIGYGKGNGWVGWRNTSLGERYVELIFEFDQLRNFSAIHLFTNNFFSKDVQVFSRAKIWFSVGGLHYNGRPLGYSYMPDRALEVARDVTIALHHRLARFVKIRLYFAASWIMLSEVLFDSEPLGYNATDEIELNTSDEEILVNPEIGVAFDTFETVQAHQDEGGYVEAVIGVLTAVMLLLLVVFVIILILSRRQKLQGSPTILRNPFGVTINMKDLLMNLAPSSNGGAGGSSAASPVGQAPPGGAGSPATSPLLVNGGTGSYVALTSSLIDCEAPSSDNESRLISAKSAPSASPSPTVTPSIMSAQSPATPTRRLISATSNGSMTLIPNGRSRVAGKGSCLGPYHQQPQSINNNNDSLRRSDQHTVGRKSESSERTKRCHTAPRDRHRVAPPVVCWNIAPSMGRPYSCRESELAPVPRYCLNVVEKFGSSHAGEVLTGNSDTASVVEHRLLPPIFASKVRLFPHSLHRRTVCLRAELLGCMDDGKVVSTIC